MVLSACRATLMGNLESVLGWCPTCKESLRGAHISLEGMPPLEQENNCMSPRCGWMLMNVLVWGLVRVLPSPHMLVLATSERFLPAGGTFRVILASESHWLQPVLVLSVHWWPALASVGRVLYNGFANGDGKACQCSFASGWWMMDDVWEFVCMVVCMYVCMYVPQGP
jgi:hypothetical protein